jgi:hypothetical protein
MSKSSNLYFKTHNETNVDINMTCLLGHCTEEVTYSLLVKIFGKPTDGDGYKVDAEWNIEFEDGLVATIYNWKCGKKLFGR